MKAINVCVIALLCIGLTAAASYKEQIYGNCGGAEQHKEKVEAKAALWGKVERVVRYSLAVSFTYENTVSTNSCYMPHISITFSFCSFSIT